MPLLHIKSFDGLVQLCSYAKIHYEPPKGGAFAPPLPPLNPPLNYSVSGSIEQKWKLGVLTAKLQRQTNLALASK